MIQISLYRTRTSGWKAELVITEPSDDCQVPPFRRYETAEIKQVSESATDLARTRRAVLELANAQITRHFAESNAAR
jgi:hypothetical protein